VAHDACAGGDKGRKKQAKRGEASRELGLPGVRESASGKQESLEPHATMTGTKQGYVVLGNHTQRSASKETCCPELKA
jgi:hypothetical protein